MAGIGSAAWDRLFGAPRPGGAAPVPRAVGPGAQRALDAGRPALPYPLAPPGPVLRAGPAPDRSGSAACRRGRRGARLPLVRRARPARLRRRHREPGGRGRGRRRRRRRRRRRVRRRRLRDRAEVPARPRGLERAHGRAAGARDRPHEAVRHRAPRRRQGAGRPRRAQRDRRPGRRGAQIVRYNMPFGRAAAGEFGTYFIGYARTPAVIEQMLDNMFVGTARRRPHPRLLDRGHRHPVLRPVRRRSSTTRRSRRRNPPGRTARSGSAASASPRAERAVGADLAHADDAAATAMAALIAAQVPARVGIPSQAAGGCTPARRKGVERLAEAAHARLGLARDGIDEELTLKRRRV